MRLGRSPELPDVPTRIRYATLKQLAYIEVLQRRALMKPEIPPRLSVADASRMIDDLLSRLKDLGE